MTNAKSKQQKRGVKINRKGKKHPGRIGKYGLNMDRRYFKENAEALGFRKYD